MQQINLEHSQVPELKTVGGPVMIGVMLVIGHQ